MQAIRQIVDAVGNTLTISIPQHFCNHRIEVILLPCEEIASTSMHSTWPAGFLDKLVGSMEEDPIHRFPQGIYENRKNLR